MRYRTVFLTQLSGVRAPEVASGQNDDHSILLTCASLSEKGAWEAIKIISRASSTISVLMIMSLLSITAGKCFPAG